MLPCGSVAVAVRIGNPAGAVKGIVKVTCPGRVGRLLERSEVVLGLARRRRARSRRWRRRRCDRSCPARCPQPALGLAVGGREEDREVLEVVGAPAEHGAIFRHPVVAEVDGLACVAEDPIGGDLIADRRVTVTATPGPPLSVIRFPAVADVPPIVLSMEGTK